MTTHNPTYNPQFQNIGKSGNIYTGTNAVRLAMQGKMREAVDYLFDEYNDMFPRERWAMVNDVPDRKRRNRLAKLVRRKEWLVRYWNS